MAEPPQQGPAPVFWESVGKLQALPKRMDAFGSVTESEMWLASFTYLLGSSETEQFVFCFFVELFLQV